MGSLSTPLAESHNGAGLGMLLTHEVLKVLGEGSEHLFSVILMELERRNKDTVGELVREVAHVGVHYYDVLLPAPGHARQNIQVLYQ